MTETHARPQAARQSLLEAKAGDAVADHLTSHYRKDGDVHFPTLVGAGAALAGENALIAAEPVLPNQGWVCSDSARELLYDAAAPGRETLWSIMTADLVLPANTLPRPGDIDRRVLAGINGRHFPPLSVDADHRPREWSPNACPQHRAAIRDIAARYNLDRRQRALSCAHALRRFLAETPPLYDMGSMLTLTLEVMIGVAHMIPLPRLVNGRTR